MAGRRNGEPPFFRRREERRREERLDSVSRPESMPLQDRPEVPAPPPDREQDRDWLFAQAEKRLTAANEAIRSTRTYFFALLSIAAYIGVIVWGTTDEQLLRISPVKLPIINVEVPLTGFYTAVPVLFVLLHFNLLIHLGLTSKKVKVFLDRLKHLDQTTADELRNDVSNFPLAQWIVGKQDVVFRVVLSLLVWILLVLIPPVLLLWMQLRFLAFQDETFTRLQAVSVAVDALLIIAFHAWFIRQIKPESRWITRLHELRDRRGTSLNLWIRLFLVYPFSLYFVPLIPISLAAYFWSQSISFMEREHWTGAKYAIGHHDKCEVGQCKLYFLDVEERLLTRNDVTAKAINSLIAGSAEKQERGLEEMLGLNLAKRSLVEAQFSFAMLPKVDFREADLRGAAFEAGHLQNARFDHAVLDHAVFFDAFMRGANLSYAKLADAHLVKANLEHATLADARMPRVDLSGANLQQADLNSVYLDGATLHYARLQGAKLNSASLARADFGSAQLKEASFRGSELIDAQFSDANLYGADFSPSCLTKLIFEEGCGWSYPTDLEGVNFSGANLEWADLTDADLSFADLTGAENLETAELAGADYVFAELEGTFLDINQPPPDVLPAPWRSLEELAFLDDTEEALAAYRRATELNPANADTWIQLGKLLARVGNLDEAEAAYQRVTTPGKTNCNREQIMIASSELGDVYQMRGNSEQAAAMYRKSLELSEAVGYTEGMAISYGRLGNVYYMRNDLDQAEAMYTMSLAIDKVLGSKDGMAISYGKLGSIYYKRNDLDQAEAMFKKGLRLWETLGRTENMANAYGSLGNIYQMRGDLEQAEAMYRKALSLFQDIGATPEIEQVQASIEKLRQSN